MPALGTITMKQYEDFLRTIQKYGSSFSSINENGKLCSLSLNFWGWEDIENGLKLGSEWDVKENYIPFYGDWHDLYCINELTGSVVYLNDQREIVCERTF